MAAEDDAKEVKEKKEKKKEKKAREEREEKKEVAKKTALGDTATMKRILDDAVIKVILEAEDSQFDEDTALSNLKLFVGFASVGSSAFSHAYPATFPKNWWVLLACCTFYFVCSGILQALLSFVELESILLVKPKPGSSKRAGLNISSHFPRFQEMYTLGITPLPKGSLFLPFAPKFRPQEEGVKEEEGCSQRSWPVNLFFDEEGTFYDELFENVVYEFIQEYQATESKKTK